jgi:hypothetical protein
MSAAKDKNNSDPKPSLLEETQLRKLSLEIAALERAASARDDKDSSDEKQDPLIDAQLRKLNLEIDALERTVSEQKSTEKFKKDKLELEIDTLKWQTGRVYRLSQFAVIFSIIATLVTIFYTGYNIWSSYTKDTENKKKELTQKTDSQYRTEIQRLIQYPSDTKMPISEVVFLLRDLEEVVKNGYEGDQQKRQKEEIGILLMQLIKSSDVDLSIPRNIEFDRSAMLHSNFYADYLVKDPLANSVILSKYKTHLKEISTAYPDFRVDPDKNDDHAFMPVNIPNETVNKQYVYTYLAYKSHVELLDRSTRENEQFKEKAEEYLGASFCAFYDATHNAALTAKIYGGDPGMVEWRRQQCE